MPSQRFDELVSKIASNDPFDGGKVCYNGRMGVEDAARLADALRVNSTVTHLGLVGNGLGDDGVEILAAGLRTNSTITMLALYGNVIGDKGARALAGLLTVNTAITELNLGSNKIGDDGAGVLASALPFNSSLATLGLNDNGIGPLGAAALAEGLLDNSSLTALAIRRNGIGDDGAGALARSLVRGNLTLTHVGLKMSGVGDDLRDMVHALLRINSQYRRDPPEEALKGKIMWLGDLGDDDARMLGFEERGPEELMRIRVESEIGWLVMKSSSEKDKLAVSLALKALSGRINSFPRDDHRRRLFRRLLGSPRHGIHVAASVQEEVGGRALYREAAGCGAAPRVLMNLLRAHLSLCACRDAEHKLYPFMLLATTSEAGVGDVMELLLQSPTLVESSIGGPAEGRV